MTSLLHFVGSYPLIIGLLSQVIVLLSSLRDKDRAAAVQSAILMGALGVISGSLLLRPHSPPNPLADSIAALGGLFLLTPGVQALLKLRQKQAEQKAGRAATGSERSKRA